MLLHETNTALLKVRSHQFPHTWVQLNAELKTFAKHLRKTHMYKQQGNFLNLIYIYYVTACDFDISVTINTTCLMSAINNILNDVRCYYIIAT